MPRHHPVARGGVPARPEGRVADAGRRVRRPDPARRPAEPVGPADARLPGRGRAAAPRRDRLPGRRPDRAPACSPSCCGSSPTTRGRRRTSSCRACRTASCAPACARRRSIGFAQAPDAIVDLWVQTLDQAPGHELLDLRLPLRHADHAAPGRRSSTPPAAEAVPAIMYGLTGVHDDEFFAARAQRDGELGGHRDDLRRGRSRRAHARAGPHPAPGDRCAPPATIPLELHCHASTGLAQHNYMEGLKAGFTILHTASRPMANGPSLPSDRGHVADPGEHGPLARPGPRAASPRRGELRVGGPGRRFRTRCAGRVRPAASTSTSCPAA